MVTLWLAPVVKQMTNQARQRVSRSNVRIVRVALRGVEMLILFPVRVYQFRLTMTLTNLPVASSTRINVDSLDKVVTVS